MLKSLFWIGATGIALVAGIAMHHGDDIERGIERGAVQLEASFGDWSEVGDHFEREMDLAEEAVDNGADAEESYENAVATALINSGLFTLDNIDEIEADEQQTIMTVNDGVPVHLDDVLESARTRLAEAQESGEVLAEDRGLDGNDINELIDTLDEMGIFDGDNVVQIQ